MDKSTTLIHVTHLHPFLWNSESLALLYRAGYTNQYIYVPDGHLPPVLPEGVDIPVGNQQVPDNAEEATSIIRLSNFMWLLDTSLIDNLAKQLNEGEEGLWCGIPAPTWDKAAIIGSRGRKFDREKMTILPHQVYSHQGMLAVFGQSWVGIGGVPDFIKLIQNSSFVPDSFANRVLADILQVSFATQPREIVDRLIQLDAQWKDKSQSLFNFLQGVRIAP